MIKVSSYLGLATFFLILYSSTCWSEQIVTGKFTDVIVSTKNSPSQRVRSGGKTDSVNYLIVSYSYKYSLDGNIDRITKPLDRLFCFFEYTDGSYKSLAIYSKKTFSDIQRASGTTLNSYEFIKLGSAKQLEVSLQSVKNNSVSGMEAGVGGKTINGKRDNGKLLWYRLELWANGKLIAEYNTVNKAVLDSKKIPEDWYIYKKYPQLIENEQCND